MRYVGIAVVLLGIGLLVYPYAWLVGVVSHIDADRGFLAFLAGALLIVFGSLVAID